jgi:hypothetical protein
MLRSVREYDRVLAVDAGKAPRLPDFADKESDDSSADEKLKKVKRKKKKKKKKDKASDDDSDSSVESDGKVDDLQMSVEELQKLSRNPREVLLKKLGDRKKKPKFKLPKNAKYMVAAPLLAKCYATQGSNVYKTIYEIAEKKGLLTHPMMDLVLCYCRSVDQFVMEEGGNALDSEGLEMMMRKIYGWWKATETVSCRADWEKPAGGKPGWESKVDESLMKEYDFTLPRDDTSLSLDGADKEVGGRLKNRALITKHLSSASKG